jgi:hypothetical protein
MALKGIQNEEGQIRTIIRALKSLRYCPKPWERVEICWAHQQGCGIHGEYSKCTCRSNRIDIRLVNAQSGDIIIATRRCTDTLPSDEESQ